MGLYLIVKIGKEDHPDWDDNKYSADYPFISDKRTDEGVNWLKHPEDDAYMEKWQDYSFDYRTRPKEKKDIDILRENIKNVDFDLEAEDDSYKQRYLKLCDLFEKDDNCWLIVSC